MTWKWLLSFTSATFHPNLLPPPHVSSPHPSFPPFFFLMFFLLLLLFLISVPSSGKIATSPAKLPTTTPQPWWPRHYKVRTKQSSFWPPWTVYSENGSDTEASVKIIYRVNFVEESCISLKQHLKLCPIWMFGILIVDSKDYILWYVMYSCSAMSLKDSCSLVPSMNGYINGSQQYANHNMNR